MNQRGRVVLVGGANKSRTQITRYLRDGGYEVLECDELAPVGPCVGVVVVDAEASESVRTGVEGWLAGAKSRRVVVISSKPSVWKTLSKARSDELYVLAAPAFGWEIIDALRAPPPASSRG